MNAMKRTALAAACAALTLCTATAHAALFEDDEARRAILDLRQRVEQQRQGASALSDELRRATEENATLRRSLLELNGWYAAQWRYQQLEASLDAA
mgnify:CR=1 FL=1